MFYSGEFFAKKQFWYYQANSQFILSLELSLVVFIFIFGIYLKFFLFVYFTKMQLPVTEICLNSFKAINISCILFSRPLEFSFLFFLFFYKKGESNEKTVNVRLGAALNYCVHFSWCKWRINIYFFSHLFCTRLFVLSPRKLTFVHPHTFSRLFPLKSGCTRIYKWS